MPSLRVLICEQLVFMHSRVQEIDSKRAGERDRERERGGQEGSGMGGWYGTMRKENTFVQPLTSNQNMLVELIKTNMRLLCEIKACSYMHAYTHAHMRVHTH